MAQKRTTILMKKPITLHNFEGPLDLLLHLIEEKQMEITQVSIADVTEQFLEYLQEVEHRLPEELADFLVIATKLLLIKSRALLPYLQMEGEEEDPRELETQLRMYKKYADAALVIEEMISRKQFLFPKTAPGYMTQVAFRPPERLSASDLHHAFVEALSRLEPVVRIPKAAITKVMTLREKFAQIQDMLEKNISMHFAELLHDSKDRAEVVVTFLALLELIKKQQISVKQHQPFAEITIEKV